MSTSFPGVNIKICLYNPPAGSKLTHYICHKGEKCCPEGCCPEKEKNFVHTWSFWLILVIVLVSLYYLLKLMKIIEQKLHHTRLNAPQSEANAQGRRRLQPRLVIERFRLKSDENESPPGYNEALQMPKVHDERETNDDTISLPSYDQVVSQAV